MCPIIKGMYTDEPINKNEIKIYPMYLSIFQIQFDFVVGTSDSQIPASFWLSPVEPVVLSLHIV